MSTNTTKYENDFKKLLSEGKEILKLVRKGSLKNLNRRYQKWYSESLIIIKILLPDRLEDFIKIYKKPERRRDINVTNYTIEDSLEGFTVKNGLYLRTMGPRDAFTKFSIQLDILNSVGTRFKSSLFDIEQLLQIDLFDSELDAAKELNKKGFRRGAGAMAGVVLESHLKQLYKDHEIKMSLKNPNIGNLNNSLKDNKIIDTPKWRSIQFLADLRNKCDHKMEEEPTKDEINQLIDGVSEVIKTTY